MRRQAGGVLPKSAAAAAGFDTDHFDRCILQKFVE